MLVGVVCALLVAQAAAIPAVSLGESCKVVDADKLLEATNLLSVAVMGLETPSEYVTEITSSNIGNNVHPLNQYTVVNVFAPWCPVSSAFAPMFDEVAKDLAVRADLKFTQVNGDNDVELRRQFEVSEYPTLLIVRRGHSDLSDALASSNVVKYTGSRTVEKIEAWIRAESPSSAKLAEDLAANQDAEGIVADTQASASL